MDSLRDAVRAGTAADIADALRDRIEQGSLAPGATLPPVRRLADELGVNRNTVVAAYRQLQTAGLVTSHGRGGTRVADSTRIPADGFAADSALTDIASGNPDPTFLPSQSRVIDGVLDRPVLYGESAVDADLAAFATEWMREALDDGVAFELSVTGGASTAIERILAQSLVRDDAVALEDPCFLASIQTARLAGYRTVPVPVDDEGMTVAGLTAALETGVRAVVTTPRAQNPTGVSLSASRAEQLRAVLAAHPYVMIIEDDHFSQLSQQPFHSLVSPAHRRFALIRSVSKFLGPDLSVALTAADPHTSARLATRPGSSWVSHILQRLAVRLLTDDDTQAQIAAAGAHYAQRNAAAVSALGAVGLAADVGDGLSLWVELPVAADAVSQQLMRRGWLARTGDEFMLASDEPSRHLRLTLHTLEDSELRRFAADLRAAIDAV